MNQPEKKDTQESAKSTTVINKKSRGFTNEERAAMKERAKELKAEERANKNKADGESDVLARIAEMPEPERAMARFGAYCLLALHKENITRRNSLLNISSKLPVIPKSGHQPKDSVIIPIVLRRLFRLQQLSA